MTPTARFRVEAGDGAALDWEVIGRGKLQVVAKSHEGTAAKANLSLAVVRAKNKSHLHYPLVGNRWLESNAWGLRIENLPNKLPSVFAIGNECVALQVEPHDKVLAEEPVVTDSNDLGGILRPKGTAAVHESGELIPLYMDDDDSLLSKAEEEMCPPPPPLTWDKAAMDTRDDQLAAAVRFLSKDRQKEVISKIRESPHAANTLGTEPAKGFVAVEKLDPNASPPAKRFGGYSLTGEGDATVMELLSRTDLFRELQRSELKNPQLAHRIAASVSVVHTAGKQRVVFNFIAANQVTMLQGTSCDPVEPQLRKLLRGGKFLVCGDLTKAFYQIELSDPDQLSLIHYKGRFFQSLRLGTGARNSMFFLHQATRVWFADLLGGPWGIFADNIFCSAPTQSEAVRQFFLFHDRCVEMNVTYNLKDLQIGAPLVTLLGYQIGTFEDGNKGYRKSDKALANVVQVPKVETFAEVARLAHLGLYAGSQVLRVNAALAPLRSLLLGKPSALKDLARIKVTEEERAIAEAARVELVEVLGDQLLVSVYRSDWRTLAFCDSCDMHWASLLVQYPPEEEDFQLFERTYTVVAVYHGSWDKRECKWHINEKELECVRRTVDNAHPLVRGGLGPLVVYSDNSTSVLRAGSEDFSEQKKSRVLRALTLLRNMRVELRHLPGALNQVADLLSRKPANELILVEPRVIALEDAPPSTVLLTSTRRGALQAATKEKPAGADFGAKLALERNAALSDQPFPRAIWQNVHPCEALPENVVSRIMATSDKDKPEKSGDKWVKGAFVREVNHTQVWVVPRDEIGTQHAIWAVCHCLGGVHPGIEATVALMQRFVVFEDMRGKVAQWNRECLTCAMCNPVKQRVQLGVNRQAFGPFDLLAMDFCDPGSTSAEGFKYLLVLCDVFSLHLRAVPVMTMAATEAARHVVKYSNDYLPPYALFSDQGSAFVSDVMKGVAHMMGYNQFLTLPDMEFSRGVIEASVGCLKQSVLKLSVSFKRGMRDFPELTQVACGLHNNTATTTPSMQGFSPNQIVFGQDRGPCTLLFKSATETFEVVLVPPDVKDYVAKMSRGVAGIHRYLLDKRRRAGLDAKPARGETRNDFEIGHYVLVAVEDRPNMATPRWDSPSCVVQQTSPRSYIVEDLVTGAKTEKHAAELRLLGSGRSGLELNEWDMIFYGAKNKHEVHDVTEFKLDAQKGLLAKFEFGRAPAAPLWKPVRDWIKKIPLLFDFLLESPRCAEPEIYKALEEMLVKAGVRERVATGTTAPPETAPTVGRKTGKEHTKNVRSG